MDARTRELCLQWGRVENSDPFAAARAACHYREGVARPFEADYSAEESFEWVSLEGVDGRFKRVVWKNVRRP